MKNIFYLISMMGLTMLLSCTKRQQSQASISPAARWTEEQATEWSEKWGWLRGANFQPSTAINQLEMWQAETFDTVTIDRELGWAEELGMNCMRVYLHHLAWEQDPDGFKDRMENYLSISWRHGIATMFVFMDDCWNPDYQAGTQPAPKPGIHNSGWVRDPGDLLYRDSTLMVRLEQYVKDILTTFGKDDRIALWDLYNEPGNSGYGNRSMPLLKKVFEWGRTVNPTQPLTVGIWHGELTDLNQYQLAQSDIISYHQYENTDRHQATIDSLKIKGRPMICSEYMARTRGSFFNNIMPLLKQNNIGAINWGFVSGKTNTIYAWDTPIPSGEEPEVWFHDIYRQDKTPYDPEEVALIQSLTGITK